MKTSIVGRAEEPFICLFLNFSNLAGIDPLLASLQRQERETFGYQSA